MSSGCTALTRCSCWDICSGTLSINWDANICASESSSSVGRARRSRLVKVSANTRGSPSTPSFMVRNCCIARSLSIGLSNSCFKRSTTDFQVGCPSVCLTLSYAAFARPLSSVPRTTVFADGSCTPFNSAIASKSLKKIHMSPSSKAAGHGTFISRQAATPNVTTEGKSQATDHLLRKSTHIYIFSCTLLWIFKQTNTVFRLVVSHVKLIFHLFVTVS
ncbi:unnamed protein product [Trichobilharzia szidati]|nr:unnamed protein product [Trichobilharzia szidati]